MEQYTYDLENININNINDDNIISLGQEVADRLHFAKNLYDGTRKFLCAKLPTLTDQEIDKLVNAKLLKDREHLLVKRGCAIKESIILNIANMPNPYEYEDNNEIQSTKIQNIDLKIRDVDDALNIDKLSNIKNQIEEKTGTHFEYVPIDVEQMLLGDNF